MNRINVLTVKTKPIPDQHPGTSGLRKKTRVFMETPNYVENFIQSVFNTIKGDPDIDLSNESLAVGGDGRYLNHEVLHTILVMAVANRFGRIYIPLNGLISTPAMSAVIRRRGALGGFILTASHNPGGVDGDFGIKYNVKNGGPAPQSVTERIYKQSLSIDHYLTIDDLEFNLDKESEYEVGRTKISVINPFTEYETVFQEIFDFDRLRDLFENGFRMTFDGMHGVTGIYAHYFLEKLLGAPEGTVIRGNPLPDFGGVHPDPNLVYNSFFVERMMADNAPDFGAANDGDGDRNMILGRNSFVSPGDSLAIITEHAQSVIPGFRDGVTGVARSMPTSTAVDRVAADLGIPCYETPTGWKFFGDLMDADLCSICGEESFGTGSNHVREKDGMWAVLSWLSIIAATKTSVKEIMQEHWKRFGRSFYQRHDYEGVETESANKVITQLLDKLPSLVGTSFAESSIKHADEFNYRDPVSGITSEHQGLRIFLSDGSRVVCRLSGTGTKGATIRLYHERYRKENFSEDINSVLKPLVDDTFKLLRIREICGRDKPTLIT